MRARAGAETASTPARTRRGDGRACSAVNPLAHESRRAAWSQQGLRTAAQATYRHGGYYFEAFGEAGDWGVRDQQWGFAICTAEWLLQRALPQWRVVWFVPGTVEGNQDLWVFERSP